MNILVDPQHTDVAMRERLFAGDLVVRSPGRAARELGAWARKWVRDALADASSERDPLRAQFELDVSDFVQRLGPLKSGFTNAEETKLLVRDCLAEAGCDLEKTYFDVPRLRIVTHGEYLTAGLGYAYKPHRDTWYASPFCQLNWWAPVFDLTTENALAFYPQYWSTPCPNSSSDFDYAEWVAEGRRLAAAQVATDERRHPLPTIDMSQAEPFQVVMRQDTFLLFSGAQLHATAPNRSGMTRFSLDFRTVDADDLAIGRGAPNIDTLARGSTLGDFLRASDFARLT